MNTRLLGVKLRAIVGDQMSIRRPSGSAVEVGQPDEIGIGAAVVAGDEAWVLVEGRQERALGIGLAWMQRKGAQRLHLLASDGAGALARRASHFTIDVDVWHVEDREISPAAEELLSSERQPHPAHLEFGDRIVESGADLVVEHGVVCGEVVGLEVCRVVDDPVTGLPRLEVGVGVHDREAFALMHGDTPVVESLRRIVDVVGRHRRPGADPHPLNRLAAERALRHRIVLEPGVIGASSLRLASAASIRTNVKDAAPCAALGETTEGEPMVAVFSTGIDLDVVPAAADIRAWHGLHDARLVVIVPERDASPVTIRLAEALRHQASVVGTRI